MSNSRRMAASRVIIEDEMYRNHVVELDQHDMLIRHYTLTEELPSTEWHNEITIKGGRIIRI